MQQSLYQHWEQTLKNIQHRKS